MYRLSPSYIAAFVSACTAACGAVSPATTTATDHSNAADTNQAVINSLPPPSHNGNTIMQIAPTIPTAPECPSPANEADFFGQPRCCHTHAAFCEDFETATPGGNPNATWWSVERASADTLAISTDHAARGKQALHIHAPGNSHSMILTKMGFPFANNEYWGRAFYYWNSLTHPSNHTTYIASGPADTSLYQWLRYSSFGKGDLGGNDSDPDNSSVSGSSMPNGGWACLEWHYDPANHLAHYLLDGKEISTLTIDARHDSDGAMNFGSLEIGWELYTADTAVPTQGWDMYIDEIALDSKQIGCAN